MRAREIITEGRGGYLYHSTSFENAIGILEENRIDALTAQTIDARRGRRIIRATGINGEKIYGWKLKGGRQLDGVSLTRSYDFALAWKGHVIFVLDQRRLDYDYKIIPTDHINGAGWDYSSPGSVNMQKDWFEQYEEFVVGPIRNLSRYLVSVNMLISDLDRVSLFTSEDEKILYRHPLVNKVYPRRFANIYDRQAHIDSTVYRNDFIYYHALKKQGYSDDEILQRIREWKPEGDDPEPDDFR